MIPDPAKIDVLAGGMILAAVIMLGAGLGGYGLRHDAQKVVVVASATDKVARIRERNLPNITLTDHTGRAVRFYDDLVRGRVVAINFMYASCSKTCELSSQNMARLQSELAERLGRDVSMYSISLDPERDTPQALAAYREKQGARPGWTFLAPATQADVADLRRKLGVYEIDAELDADLSSHTGMIVLGNEPIGRWTMIPSLVHPIRIRQALERVIFPPSRWVGGEALIGEVPREDNDVASRR